MSSLPCPVPYCDRLMPAHLHVCGACEARLIRDLAAAPDLADELDVTLTRQARTGASGARADADELDLHTGLAVRRAPLPWVEAAAEARDILKSALVGWWRELEGDGIGPYCGACEHPSCEWVHLGRTPDDSIAGIAAWLARHVARLVAHPAAEEAVDELAVAVATARHAIDRAADRIYAGPCDACGLDLYARPGAATVACACVDATGRRRVYDVAARRGWMLDQVSEMIGNASWVASVSTALGYVVSPSTVRTWGGRGRLTIRGHSAPLNAGADPHPLYRVGDVIERVRQHAATKEKAS
ncbi:hypothetical protein ACFFMN_33845 [Planobispora siamensis]|uniref:Uncharacterized protein n=1 Tax=Planobispora siamensis TaxID=936338 RepID=A0A8J3SF76_9ACTN|nr:hypothetical protein [Planobispora siamensis]GIH91965.1 hypothetical protein Psi01_25950 [Planobispora siamensis]